MKMRYMNKLKLKEIHEMHAVKQFGLYILLHIKNYKNKTKNSNT